MKKTVLIMVLTLCGAAGCTQRGSTGNNKYMLIICNTDYSKKSLNYPIRDMSDKDTKDEDYRIVDKLRDVLTSKGWKIVKPDNDNMFKRGNFKDGILRNCDINDMKKAVDLLTKEMGSSSNSQCLFYYIGHARATYKVNYLYPVRSTPIDDVETQTLSLDNVVRQMNDSNKNEKNFIIIDYSRNQPYNGMMGARRRAAATRWSNLVQRQ